MPSDRRTLTLVLTATLAVWTGCGDDDGGRPVPPSDGGAAGSRAPNPSAGAPPTANEGGAGDRGDGGASGGGPSEAGAGGVVSAGGGAGGEGDSAGAGGEPFVGPDPDSVCPAGMELDEGVQLSGSSEYGTLAAVTADELVSVWVLPSNGAMQVRTAVRESASDPFGAPLVQEVTTPDPVAISPDGLELTFVNPDRRGFSLMSRAALDEPFAPASSAVFALIDEAMENASEDELLGDPVLAPNGLGLYYSRYGGGRQQTLLHSQRISPFAPWPNGSPVGLEEDSVADDLVLLRPVASSYDAKTLFLFDTQAEETVAFRVALDGTRYVRDTVLQDVGRVSTNGDCTRAYYSTVSDSISYVSDVTTEQ